MRFLVIPKADPAAPATELHAGALDESIFAAYMKYNEELAKAGVLVASEGLAPEGARARLAVKGGKRVVTDGPFTEAKELIGGFYVLECASREEAIAWASRCPTGLGGDEILEIYEMTEIAELPPRLQEINEAVAPTWRASLTRSGK